ncbi:predicted protein [Uncinocarpus reesii 1704]|uniref:UBC core domain-containing protein n=1 Tax=Uncinocarpus reesii (strain UAMH 1704) TaxID=336963 RepID=C4JL90_UNCRE|nr:uncharacterized protein UREG_03598 [Uncinocarpus reesii 1704]EEP78752.1 predicted protein [Uncinocarpus reesii 1704]
MSFYRRKSQSRHERYEARNGPVPQPNHHTHTQGGPSNTHVSQPRAYPTDIEQSIKAVQQFIAALNGYYINTCCRHGRTFGMWVLLARYDEIELEIQASSSNSEDPYQQRHLSRRGRTGTNDSRGVGYADDGQANPWATAFYGGRAGPLRFRSSDSKIDSFLATILQAVRTMIPSNNNKNLPPELRGMFQLSMLIDKLAELLRNDSLEDITSRTEVYMAAFQFVRKLGDHPELIVLLQTPRHHKQKTPGLEALTLRSGSGLNGAGQALSLGETIPSVAEKLQKLAKQSDIVLSTKESEDLTSRGGKEMLDICKEIAAVYAAIAAGNVQCENNAQSVDQYQAYHQNHCVTRDESILTRGHTFSAVASRMAYSPPGRMKRLLAELANMATSLPVGIFVKVSESRPDIMRCLVMGPPDSPYGYGLFDLPVTFRNMERRRRCRAMATRKIHHSLCADQHSSHDFHGRSLQE